MKITVFGASWCGPCKMLKGALSRANKEYEYIDIDSDPNKAFEENIKGVPTIIIRNGDKEISRFTGFSPEVISKIEEVTG